VTAFDEHEQVVVFLSGPYRENGRGNTAQHVHRASLVAREVFSMSTDARLVIPLVPHTMYQGMDDVVPLDRLLEADQRLLRGCDVVLMLEGWTCSTGAVREHAEATRHGVPVCLTTAALRRWVREGA